MWDKPLAKVVKLLYIYICMYIISIYIYVFYIYITLYNMQLNDIKKVENRGVNACALGPIRSH
jgi:cell division protein FtsL